MKKEKEKQLDLKFSYNQKIISPQCAIAMAKNIFVHGDFKKLRASLRKLQKDTEKFNENLPEYNEHEEKFKSTEWTRRIGITAEIQTLYHFLYKILEPKYSDNRAAALIADAILREPHAAQLVARSTGNNLETEKEWELLSELDKDSFRHNKIFRDL